MYLVDFIFDGIRLSDFGCTVGYAVTGNEDSISMGSILRLDTIVNHGSYLTEVINTDYEGNVTCTFDIIRKNCGNWNGSFSDNEVTWFMNWLNKKEFKKFIPIYNDSISFYKLFFMGTFSEVKAIRMGKEIIGFTLTLTTSSPFGYLDVPQKTFTISSANGYFDLYNETEEDGYLYPGLFRVTCSVGGNLTIRNSLENNRATIVNNCSTNEVITFDCIHKIISSSRTGHDRLFNDFNYNFPRLIKTKEGQMNRISSNIPCSITLEYKPIRKVGVI